MKKHAIAFMVGLTVMVTLSLISTHLIEVPDFLIGWFSCIGWIAGMESDNP